MESNKFAFLKKSLVFGIFCYHMKTAYLLQIYLPNLFDGMSYFIKMLFKKRRQKEKSDMFRFSPAKHNH